MNISSIYTLYNQEKTNMLFKKQQLVEVNKKKNAVYINIEQLKYYQYCPMYFKQRTQNNISDMIATHNFNILQNQQFNHFFRNILGYKFKHQNKKLKANILYKYYLNMYRRFKTKQLIMDKYEDSLAIQIDQQKNQIETTYLISQKLEQYRTNTIVDIYNIYKTKKKNVLLYKVNDLLDFDLEYDVYIKFSRPYVFTKRYFYNKETILIPYVPLKNFQQIDYLFIDNIQLLTYQLYKNTITEYRNKLKHIKMKRNINFEYKFLYIKPGQKEAEITKLPNKAYAKNQIKFLNSQVYNILSDNIYFNFNDNCVNCEQQLYCLYKNTDNKEIEKIYLNVNKQDKLTELRSDIYQLNEQLENTENEKATTIHFYTQQDEKSIFNDNLFD